MFDINTYIIYKMGWCKYYTSTSLGIDLIKFFHEDELCRYFIKDRDRNLIYIIKESTKKEKQKIKKQYKFIILNYKSEKINWRFFDSNHELFKFIIDNEACNFTYKRNFKIKKLLRCAKS